MTPTIRPGLTTNPHGAAEALRGHVQTIKDSDPEVHLLEPAMGQVNVRRSGSDEYVHVLFTGEPPHSGDVTPAAKLGVERVLSDLRYKGVEARVTLSEGNKPVRARAPISDARLYAELGGREPLPDFDPAFLKVYPFPFSNPVARKLIDHLANTFAAQSIGDRVALLESADLSPAEVRLETPSRQFWRDAVEHAAGQLKLPKLLEQAHDAMPAGEAKRLGELLSG